MSLLTERDREEARKKKSFDYQTYRITACGYCANSQNHGSLHAPPAPPATPPAATPERRRTPCPTQFLHANVQGLFSVMSTTPRQDSFNRLYHGQPGVAQPRVSASVKPRPARRSSTTIYTTLVLYVQTLTVDLRFPAQPNFCAAVQRETTKQDALAETTCAAAGP